MYELKLRDNVKRLEFTVKVVGNVNNTVYIMEETTLNEEEFNKALPFILALFKLEEVEQGYRDREELWEEFYFQEEIKTLVRHMLDHIFIPTDEWVYAHTIESIEITAQKDGMIYDVIIDKDKVLPIPLKD